MSIDRVSNMLSSIKNASMAGNRSLEVPHSKECESILKVLEESEYVENVKIFKPKNSSRRMINIELAKEGEDIKISEVKRLSRPGKRVYRKASELKLVQSGYGVLVVSTSRGVMSGEEAKKKKLGGELICKVY